MTIASSARQVASVAIGAATLAVGAPTAYVAALTLMSRPRPEPPVGRIPDTRFAVFVPAHDEAEGIGATLASLTALRYPSDMFQVFVVADNCTDDTAEVVRRHGVEAFERDTPDDRGKGPALNWLLDRLQARSEPFDVVVVVDADTSVDPVMLTALDQAMAAGADVAQGFYTVREPEVSPVTSLRLAALAGRHHVRPSARTRYGGSCGLFGNGMAFRRSVLARHRWSGHLVEDHEFQLKLLLDGTMVAYVPAAVVAAEMPSDLDQSTSQNERWERGRQELTSAYGAPLARRVLSGPDRVAAADALADLLTPPLAVGVASHVGLGVLSVVGSLADVRAARAATVVHVAGVAALIAHVVVALSRIGASRQHRRALASAPRFIVWKAQLWWRMLRADQVAWTRTERNRTEGEQAVTT